MKWMMRLLIVVMFCILAGCLIGRTSGYVDASAWSANYTEDYIQDFAIETVDGKATGMGGIQVQEFSRGGKGGRECCSLIPGVGQTIRVVWHIGGRQDDESKWKAYSRDVVLRGATSADPDDMNFLIVRFFPGHTVEAEFVSESAKPDGKASPRVDKLFYGLRVMRQVGE